MKKITLLIILLTFSLGYSQDPATGPTDPIARIATDVKSIYNGIASPVAPQYTNEPNGTFDSFGGSNIVGDVTLGDGNTVIKYTNHLYSGIRAGAGDLDVSQMTKLHIDVYSPGFTVFKIKLEAVNGSQVELDVPGAHVQGSWNSFDLDLSTYSAVDLAHLKWIVPVSYTPPGETLYIDNVYFYRPAAVVGTPVIGSLTVPAKNLGDAPFNLTDPTSNSPGAFTYSSSNLSVATISGNTVTVVGAGTSTITATQAASGAFLTGSVSANLVVSVVPLVAAPTPPARNASDVKSIFSDAYAPITTLVYSGDNNSYSTSWSPAITTKFMIGVNDTNKITGLGSGLDQISSYEGIDFQGGRINATGFTHFHMDIWTPTATLDKSFNIKFSNWKGGTAEVNAIEYSGTNGTFLTNPNPGAWISIDIPLSDFTIARDNLDRDDLVQLIISSNLGTVYYDNIYLYKGTALGNTKFEASNVKMYPNPVKNTLTIEANSAIQKVSIYNILGQEVLVSTPKTNAATLQTSTLQKGTYVVKTNIDGNISTSKIIKE